MMMSVVKSSVCCALLLASQSFEYAVAADSAVTEESIERMVVSHRQAYRGDVPVKELPQSVELISAEIMQDAALVRFQDALDFSASIARQNNGGGLWDSFSLRGFPGNENMPSGYLINGFNGGRGFSGHRDLSNVAYIEIMKGPGSALYGRSEPGGTINIVTRKPQHMTEGYVQLSAGRFDQYRLEGDFTTGLTDTVAFRINGAWQDYDSFRDYVYADKKIVTPSVHIMLSEQSSLLYEFEYLEQNQLFDRGIVVLNGDVNTVPASRYLGEPSDGATTVKATGHQLSYEYQLNGGWLFTAGYGYRHSSLRGLSSDAELAAGRQSLFDDGETLTRQRRYRDYQSDDHSVRFEFSGHAALFDMTHHLLFGGDAYDYQFYTLLSRFRGPKGTYPLNIHQPVYGSTAAMPMPLYQNDEGQQAWGIYFQDQIDVTDQWKLLLGLRFDHYRQDIEEQLSGIQSDLSGNRTSPRLGVVYVLSPQLSLYGSYSEGFLPLSGTDAYGNAFSPEESDSVEVGIKFSGEAFSGTLALFDATKSNILTSDPINVGFSAPLGEARSKGIELDIQGHLTDSLSITASYAYLDTRTTKDSIALDWGIAVPAGSPLVNVPQNTASVILKQQLSAIGIDGHAGLRIRYSGQRLGDSADLSYRLSSYTLYGLFFESQLSDAVTATINIDNLFDKFYISNAYSAMWTVLGEPRNIRAGIRYEF